METRKEETLTNRIKDVARLFLEKSKGKEILVVSHFDTDGITSAAVMTKCLKRLDKKFSVKIIKSLEEQFIYDLPKDKLIVFLDLASGSLNYISESRVEEVFIIDHHELSQEIPQKVTMINPHLHKDNQKISSSCLTYLFAKEISSKF